MVVFELPVPPIPATDGSDGSHRLVHSMRLARAGQSVRTVFVRGETVGRVGTRRIVALVERNERLGDRVRLLRSLLEGLVPLQASTSRLRACGSRASRQRRDRRAAARRPRPRDCSAAHHRAPP